MSEPIKPGDLVVVVGGTLCCGKTETIGFIGVVLSLATSPMTFCPGCNTTRPSEDELKLDNGFVYERVRLKRIPPLSELEGEERREELTA